MGIYISNTCWVFQLLPVGNLPNGPSVPLEHPFGALQSNDNFWTYTYSNEKGLWLCSFLFWLLFGTRWGTHTPGSVWEPLLALDSSITPDYAHGLKEKFKSFSSFLRGKFWSSSPLHVRETWINNSSQWPPVAFLCLCLPIPIPLFQVLFQVQCHPSIVLHLLNPNPTPSCRRKWWTHRLDMNKDGISRIKVLVFGEWPEFSPSPSMR